MREPLKWHRTHCGRLDHGGCRILAGVRNGRIEKIRPDPGGPLNRGYLCIKCRSALQRLHHPDRLRSPLVRTGPRGSGKWRSVSWEEALDRICGGLQQTRERFGARAVSFCQGMPKGLEHFVLIRLANLFGSPNVVAVQDMCHAPREIAGIHTCGFYPVVDFHEPGELVVLWGSNATATNEEGHICRPLTDALRQGTRLLIIDPKKTDLHGHAEMTLQLRPGTDADLALAFLHVIIKESLFDAAFVNRWTWGFEDLARHAEAFPPERVAPRVGVPAGDIRRAAETYARAKPAAIAWGNAVEQTRGAFDTARLLVCLMAVCGNLDVPGGNLHPVEPRILGLGAFVRADLLPEKKTEMIHAHFHTVPRLMTVPGGYFRKAVLTETPYPVRAAYFQCTNPMITWANSRETARVFQQLDFIAVSDIFMTPTAAMADVVLPAATQFEFNDIGHYGLGHGFILARPQLVPPPADCRSDIRILNEIGRRTTDARLWPTDPDAFLDMILEPAAMTYREFADRGMLQGEKKYRKHEAVGFRTPTGKVELMLSRAATMGLSALPGGSRANDGCHEAFPLLLTCAKDPLFLHSAYRWVEALRRRRPLPLTEMHPVTAREAGISDGDPVVIETRNGRIVQYARVISSIRPGVVSAAPGWWYGEQETGASIDWQSANYNMLTDSDSLGKELGTPDLRGIPCRILPLQTDPAPELDAPR